MNLIPLHNNELWLRLIANWRNDLSIKKQLRTSHDTDYDGQVKWVEKCVNSNDEYYFIVDLEKSGADKPKTISTLYGYCGLDKISPASRTAEISLLIAPQFHKKGVGKEAIGMLLHKAFAEFNLKTVFAESHFNKDFWIKCGFNVEAELRNRKYWDGGYHNGTILSISKEEYYNE